MPWARWRGAAALALALSSFAVLRHGCAAMDDTAGADNGVVLDRASNCAVIEEAGAPIVVRLNICPLSVMALARRQHSATLQP